ncbi:MAG TPA: hypothetical protein VF743_05505 [Acidimicrobiales bacterium]
MLRRRPAALGLVAWTVLVWTTRIGNIWRDDGLDTAGKVGRTALALSFTLLAGAVVVALWRRRDRATRWAVGLLAAWTTAVWLVRGSAIVAGDHDAAFTAVHVVLAVVSIALAALAWREERRSGAHGPPAAGIDIDAAATPAPPAAPVG